MNLDLINLKPADLIFFFFFFPLGSSQNASLAVPSPPTDANTLTEGCGGCGLGSDSSLSHLTWLLSYRSPLNPPYQVPCLLAGVPFASSLHRKTALGQRPCWSGGLLGALLSPPSDISFLRLSWALDHFSDFWEHEYMRPVSVWIPYLCRCSGVRFSRTALGFHYIFCYLYSIIYFLSPRY